MRVMINGRAGAGKDEIANYLVKQYGFTKISFADPIYKIARDYFDMGVKDRRLLQQIGEGFREIDPDVWMKYAFKSINDYENVVISDLRRGNEYSMGIKNGFVPIRVISDLDIRVNRLYLRDGIAPDLSLLENDSETGADDFAYIEIQNNGTLTELYTSVCSFLFGSTS